MRPTRRIKWSRSAPGVLKRSRSAPKVLRRCSLAARHVAFSTQGSKPPLASAFAARLLLLLRRELLAVLLARSKDRNAGAHLDRRARERVLRRLAPFTRRGARRLASFHALGDRRLVAVVGREVVAAGGELVGQVLLLDVGALVFVRVAVADADAVVLERRHA